MMENNVYKMSSIYINQSSKKLNEIAKFNENRKLVKQSCIVDSHSPNCSKKSNVIIFKKKSKVNICPENTLNLPIDISVSAFDAVIGLNLTCKQEHYIHLLVKKIKLLIEVEDDMILVAKIKYYLLSSSHFRACRRDFAHKLEAIYVVVVHGSWKEIRE